MSTPDELKQVADIVKKLYAIEAEDLRRSQYKINSYFQATGPYRRELYPKYLAWFAAGANERLRERAIVAGNRTGKTQSACFETTLHATGEYPDWWVGKRFTAPIRGWCCGTSNDKTKNIVQVSLLGPDEARGTGMIPARAIHHTVQKKGSDMVDTIWIRHQPTGGLSVLQMKSYAEGRTGFEGTSQHLVWYDEEPPEDVYTEGLIRTMKTSDFCGGIILATFTPLEGQTQVVSRFVPNGVFPEDGWIRDEEKAA